MFLIFRQRGCSVYRLSETFSFCLFECEIIKMQPTGRIFQVYSGVEKCQESGSVVCNLPPTNSWRWSFLQINTICPRTEETPFRISVLFVRKVVKRQDFLLLKIKGDTVFTLYCEQNISQTEHLMQISLLDWKQDGCHSQMSLEMTTMSITQLVLQMLR